MMPDLKNAYRFSKENNNMRKTICAFSDILDKMITTIETITGIDGPSDMRNLLDETSKLIDDLRR